VKDLKWHVLERKKMKLIVNGEEKTTQSKTVQNLLDELGINEKVMAAAVNMNVVKKENWSSFELSENDKVEFLQFVGGG
jgi:sulfur carrier protein